MAQRVHEPVERMFPFEVRNTSGDSDGLTLEGYAAVFGLPTTITDRSGTYTETVARGAFRKTLQERTPSLLFDHGKHPHVGSMPIGQVIDAHEDAHGVYVQARLFDNDMTLPIRQAIEGGAISGMSFRFEVIHDDWAPDRSTRTLREVRCPEFGPVVMPAYEHTTVSVRQEDTTMVKSSRTRVPTTRAQRQRRLRALAARTGKPIYRPGASRAERVQIAQQLGISVEPSDSDPHATNAEHAAHREVLAAIRREHARQLGEELVRQGSSSITRTIVTTGPV